MDKDFDGQIVESVDIGNCVSILIDGSCEWFAFLWKGSDNEENVCFSYVVSIVVTTYKDVDEGFFNVLKDKILQICASQQNMC